MKIIFILATVLTCTFSCQSTPPITNPRQPNQENPTQVTDDKIEFDFIHTKQNCKAENTEQPGTFHKKTYCLNINGDDMKQADADSKMTLLARQQLSTLVEKINPADPKPIEDLPVSELRAIDPENSKLFIAYLSFSNKSIQRKICDLASLGIKVRIFLDGGSGPSKKNPIGQIDELIMNNTACNQNVKLSYLGGSTDTKIAAWQLHHNKFLMIEAPNKKVIMNFSSGNLSSYGTSLHMDHWVTIKAPVNSNLIRAQKCVMIGLEAAAKANEDTTSLTKIKPDKAYLIARETCFDENDVKPRKKILDTEKQINDALNKEEIAPLYSPNADNSVEKSILKAISSVPENGYLYIAIQHFTSKAVANALIEAAKKNVDVRIVMDDDALRGESDVPGVDQIINTMLTESKQKIKIRFAETYRPEKNPNGSAPAVAMMHNKFAIFNGQKTFSGAGQYTGAAMKTNWENFYFITNKKIITEYSKYFNEIWNESVDYDYTLSRFKTASKDPEILNAEFSKSIGDTNEKK